MQYLNSKPLMINTCINRPDSTFYFGLSILFHGSTYLTLVTRLHCFNKRQPRHWIFYGAFPFSFPTTSLPISVCFSKTVLFQNVTLRLNQTKLGVLHFNNTESLFRIIVHPSIKVFYGLQSSFKFITSIWSVLSKISIFLSTSSMD